jgi:hypothetical protein
VGWTGGGADVFIDCTGVLGTGANVDAGIKVVPLCGIAVRGVAVSMKKRKGVGEDVVVGVIVGVGVTVRVFDAVGVGPVAVGKGP